MGYKKRKKDRDKEKSYINYLIIRYHTYKYK